MKKIIGCFIVLFLVVGCAPKEKVKIEDYQTSSGREEALKLKKEADRIWQVERWEEKDPKKPDPDDL